jgi:hypothetical protein
MNDDLSKPATSLLAMAVFATGMLLCAGAWAAEPYKVDVTQQSLPEAANSVDHLLPVYTAQFVRNPIDGPPGARYLAVYFENIFMMGEPAVTHYFVLFRTKEGHYLLRTGPVAEKIPLWPETPEGCMDVEIPESMAGVIYEIWVNELLETRHERTMLTMMPHDITYEFSACVPGLGLLDGTIRGESAGKDQPTQWMIDAGRDLLKFAGNPRRREPKKMEAKLIATRDELLQYLKLHGVN